MANNPEQWAFFGRLSLNSLLIDCYELYEIHYQIPRLKYATLMVIRGQGQGH